jgi:hypothetical protein
LRSSRRHVKACKGRVRAPKLSLRVPEQGGYHSIVFRPTTPKLDPLLSPPPVRIILPSQESTCSKTCAAHHGHLRQLDLQYVSSTLTLRHQRPACLATLLEQFFQRRANHYCFLLLSLRPHHQRHRRAVRGSFLGERFVTPASAPRSSTIEPHRSEVLDHSKKRQMKARGTLIWQEEPMETTWLI